MPKPRVLVLRAPGTNCDEETAFAWQRAGAEAETWHVGRVVESPGALDSFQILTLPGGFSYGDDLGAGRILATRLGTVLGDALRRFRERDGLVLGICNGFPGPGQGGPPARHARETARHPHLQRLGPLRGPVGPPRATSGLSPFLVDDEPIELPVAHGEGEVCHGRLRPLDPRIGRSGRPPLCRPRRQAHRVLPRQSQRLPRRRGRRLRPDRPSSSA